MYKKNRTLHLWGGEKNGPTGTTQLGTLIFTRFKYVILYLTGTSTCYQEYLGYILAELLLSVITTSTTTLKRNLQRAISATTWTTTIDASPGHLHIYLWYMLLILRPWYINYIYLCMYMHQRVWEKTSTFSSVSTTAVYASSRTVGLAHWNPFACFMSACLRNRRPLINSISRYRPSPRGGVLSLLLYLKVPDTYHFSMLSRFELNCPKNNAILFVSSTLSWRFWRPVFQFMPVGWEMEIFRRQLNISISILPV